MSNFLKNEKSFNTKEFDDDFSCGCLYSQLNSRRNNHSDSTSRLVSQSKIKTKFDNKNDFFRFITKTHCDILKHEQKDLNEKILMFYKKADYKLKESEKDMYISLDQIVDYDSLRFNQSISIISQTHTHDLK